MNALILTNEQESELDHLNDQGEPIRQLKPVELSDGRRALNADLLTDAGPGQTWSHYGKWLAQLEPEEIGPELLADGGLN